MVSGQALQSATPPQRRRTRKTAGKNNGGQALDLLTIPLETDADLFKGLLTLLFLGAYQNRCSFDQRS